MVILQEAWFLIVIALIWIVIEIIQDFKSREVANWWNFSLIFLVLGYRGFLSIHSWNYWWFLWGLIGLGVGFGIANLFYYSRMFAGGDAKLLMALGSILPLTLSFNLNLKILIVFLICFLIFGGIYGLIYSVVLSLVYFNDFKKSFVKEFLKNKFLFYVSFIVASICLFAYLFTLNSLFIGLGILIILSGILLIFAKSVEESCLVKNVKIKDLTVGDWLVHDVTIGKKNKKVIHANWDGLMEEDLEVLRKSNIKKIKIRYGIPFTPSFLFGFVGVLIWIYLFDFFNFVIF